MRIATLLAVTCAFVTCGAAYFSFTADDGLIVSRYAYHFVNHGSLVYNLGEPISALTSPLHAVVEVGLVWIFGDPVVPYKVLGLVFLITATVLLAWPFRSDLVAASMPVFLIFLSPFAILWALGGLETPLLLVGVAFLLASSYERRQVSPAAGTLFFVVAGLVFLTRYDAALFLLPASLMALRRMRPGAVLLSIVAGSLLPIAWFAVSYFYYGDLLPTSFYVKTPSFTSMHRLAANALYLFEFYLFSGFILIHMAALMWALSDPAGRTTVLRGHWAEVWPCYLSVFLIFLYGLSAAMTHMMFSFRLLVPYLPILALLSADLLVRIRRREHDLLPGTERKYGAVAIFLVILQASNFATQYFYSLGASRIGEWRVTGLRQAIGAFRETPKDAAAAIREHWKTVGTHEGRVPRLFTDAAGAIGFALPEMYVYDALVSYRHRCRKSADDLKAAADYVYLATADSAELSPTGQPGDRTVIFSRNWDLSGLRFRWQVEFNPAPTANPLPPAIDDECRVG